QPDACGVQENPHPQAGAVHVRSPHVESRAVSSASSQRRAAAVKGRTQADARRPVHSLAVAALCWVTLKLTSCARNNCGLPLCYRFRSTGSAAVVLTRPRPHFSIPQFPGPLGKLKTAPSGPYAHVQTPAALDAPGGLPPHPG